MGKETKMICIECHENKADTDFSYKKIHFKGRCKICRNRESKRQYKIRNYFKILNSGRPGNRIRNARYRLRNSNKIKLQKQKFYKNKCINVPWFKAENALRAHIYRGVKMGNCPKKYKTKKYLGCSLEVFVAHIESKFKPGMTWNNYGVFGWHIDHIVPCSYFDLSKETERMVCFNYKNLQPLWAKDNMSKGNKLDYQISL